MIIDGTICINVALICLTAIKIYKLSIEKSIHETERAKAFAEMYKAERETKYRPIQAPGHKK